MDKILKPAYAAIAAGLLVLVLTGGFDSFARRVHLADQRAAVSIEAESLARNLNDVIARETSAVDALSAFVATNEGNAERLAVEFPEFGEALVGQGETIRSVQLAPDSILRFVFPIDNNEAAVGLDLMADPARRALLEPAIASGETVVQGPVELVQGGTGLIVRSPYYSSDGAFWGFTAVVLDWPAVAALTEIGSDSDMVLAGVRLPETSDVIAGDPEAFSGDPVLREIHVGATDTVWEVAARPPGGWQSAAPLTPALWASGAAVALLAGWFAWFLGQKPEMLRRERERAIEDLATAEARYQTTFEHAGVGIMTIDHTGRILRANPSMCQMAGFDDADDLVGVPAMALIHPESRDVMDRQGACLRGGAEVAEAEVRIESRGNARWCQIRSSMIRGDDPKQDIYISIAQDITVRRATKQALADSELRFRELFELAPIAIQREDFSAAVVQLEEIRASGVTSLRSHLAAYPEILSDLLAKVKITDANPASKQLQNHLATGSEEATLLDRFTEDAVGTFIDTLVAIWHRRVSADLLVDTRAADGSPQHLDVRWHAAIVDGQPDYSNVMATISDVTELKETGRRLQDILESKDRFLASVAHELRTPLTAVVGFAEELNAHPNSYSRREQDEFHELIALHSTELSHIIEDLLVWARSDIGQVHIHPRQFNLGNGVRQNLRMIPGANIKVTEPDGAVEVVADPARVRQIVRNLLTNASRYGGEDVTISVGRSNGSGTIEVSDNGPEIPPDRASRIFQAYERSDNGDSSQPGSIGLGLTVSRSLARLQSGDLIFAREAGRNVFRVSLPISHEPANSEALVQ